VIAATAGASPRLIAQQPITIPNSEIHDLHSKVNDSDYKLFHPAQELFHKHRQAFPCFLPAGWKRHGNDCMAYALATALRRERSDLRRHWLS
jgi:hypothetical protein